MGSLSFERSVSENENHVRLTDTGDSLRDKEGGRFSAQSLQRLSERRIGRKVERARAVVEDQDLRLLTSARAIVRRCF